MALVFQYGSNCSESEINGRDRLRGDAKFADIAETVEDFELAFNVYSINRGCEASDIVRKDGEKVWVVLYEIPDSLIRRTSAQAHGRKSLDAIEGEGTNYKREMIQVRRPDGQITEAFTYTVISPTVGLKTSVNYVRLIVCGLSDHNISNEYIAKVKAIAAANNPDIAEEIKNL